jgi:type VI secretion system secreted protein VgrG
LTAQKDLKITSTEGRVEINAANGILLASGGGYIRIEGGDVQVHGPGTIDVKGAQHAFGGPASMESDLPELPRGELADCPNRSKTAAGDGQSVQKA